MAAKGIRQKISRDVSAWNHVLQFAYGKGCYGQVLHIYQQMREAGAHPNASTFPSLIGSCFHLLSLQLGLQIQSRIIVSGCDFDEYVGSSLVRLYSGFQQIEAARKLFDGLSKRSVVSWASLICGYAKSGMCDEAFELFGLMQLEDGIKPNGVTIMSLIPACHTLKDVECLHGCILKQGFGSDSLVGTSLMDIYLKCGAAKISLKLFHDLEYKNRVSWYVIVSGLAQNGFIKDAVSLTNMMLLDWNIVLDHTALSILVSACADMEDLDYGMWAHLYIIKTGSALDVFLGTALLDMYGKCSFPELASQIFKQLPERNLVSWNAVIHSHAQNGLLEDVMKLFWLLNHEGLHPDSITIRSCILALVSSPYYAKEYLVGECLHGLAVKYGFSDIETTNSILYFYAKMKNFRAAEDLFSSVTENKEIVSWNCLIGGLIQSGYGEKAICFFSQIKSEDLRPDSFTLSKALSACACIGSPLLGKYVHGYVAKQDPTNHAVINSFVETALVDMYAKCGDIHSAYKVFNEIHFKDPTTWNAMIMGFGQNGYASDALALFYYHINFVGGLVSGSEVSTATIACGSLGHLGGGKCLQGCLLKKGLINDIAIENSMISMYSKCGSVADANNYFEQMAKKDVMSWTTMISGFGINGNAHAALSFFETMKKTNVEPNQVTFLEILWVCSHGGLVEEGWNYFEQMRKEYKIEPIIQHYCCLVDLLGRAGFLYEAYLLIRSIQLKPDAAIWSSLLSSCRVHQELELAKIAGFELLNLQKVHGNDSYYVLVSNAFAAGGWWETVANIREEVRCRGFARNKSPGRSQIEVR